MNSALTSENRMLTETGRQITAKAGNCGLFASNIPSELGRAGLTAFESSLSEQEFGATTDVLIHRAPGCVYEVMLSGTEEQREIWLEPSITGDRMFAVAFTETVAGSDAGRIKTRAVKDGNGWSLNGTTTYIGDGDFDDIELPANRLLGPEGGGLKLILTILGRVRSMRIDARTVGPMSQMRRAMAESSGPFDGTSKIHRSVIAKDLLKDGCDVVAQC